MFITAIPWLLNTSNNVWTGVRCLVPKGNNLLTQEMVSFYDKFPSGIITRLKLR